jgi:predicted component of type VI protein secretion system
MKTAMISRKAIETALNYGFDDVIWYSWSTDRFCVKGTEAISEAIKEHESRLSALASVKSDLEYILEIVSD